MSKFNQSKVRPAVTSPVTSERVPSGLTFEGAPGYARGSISELYLLSVSNMVGEGSFYEPAGERDSRFVQLVHQVAVEDWPWLARFLPWLRQSANMRSAPLVAALEAAKARQAADAGPTPDGSLTPRQLVAAVLQRPDEPGEALAYWLARYGRKIPIAVNRGLTDAVVRLYTERSLLKYDSPERAVRFGDVIDMCQPTYHVPSARGTWRDTLYGHALDRRHNRDKPIPAGLRLLCARAELMALPAGERRAVLADPQRLEDAGMTWEALVGWLGGQLDAQAWEAIIPSMGYMALLRNLRAFDQAGVSDIVAARVAARLSDSDQVAASKQFPFRFLAAYRTVPSLRWSYPLEQALGHSLANVPALPGRTLVLVDRSPSMWQQKFSAHSTMPWADAAAVFGTAVAQRAENADLVEFGIENGPVRFKQGESLLKILERFRQLGGTDIPSAVRKHYKGHDRVVIVTDEQTRPGWLPSNGQYYGGSPETRIDDLIPANVPLYMWNFGGYQHGATPSGSANRHTFGGLTDQAFALVPLLEGGRDGAWPF